ncbi:MAG: hypothetical protein V2A71_08615, partial [Candidatus Eisenbacteria bacterium]
VPILVGACVWHANRPIRHGPGEVAPLAPVQTPVGDCASFTHRDCAVKPLASFHVKARVLSKKNYRLGREAKLSPVDLALGWGPMSDERTLNRVSTSQFDRYYTWSVKEFFIPRAEIERNSANMHMIPASPDVERALKTLRKGSLVEFEGYLVEITAPDGWRWKSSLSRSDTGGGACEVVWVEELNVL